MPYVDGYVIPVPVANRDAYRRLAELAAPIRAWSMAQGLYPSMGGA